MKPKIDTSHYTCYVLWSWTTYPGQAKKLWERALTPILISCWKVCYASKERAGGDVDAITGAPQYIVAGE